MKVKNFFNWVYNNSYSIVCYIAAAFFIGLIIWGCSIPGMPTDTPTTPPVPVVETFIVELGNEMPTWWTVSITKHGQEWQDNHVLDPQEVLYIRLEKGGYKVCLSKEWEVEQICVDKKVTGENDRWIIKKR